MLLMKLAGEYWAQFPVQGPEKEFNCTLNSSKRLLDKEKPWGEGGGRSVRCILQDTHAITISFLQLWPTAKAALRKAQG